MPESLLLTEAERLRFMRYCEQNAHSYGELAKQLDNLPGGAGPFALVKQHQLQRAAAYALIARELRETESMSIGPSEAA
jgi:hypothetical protein